MKLFLDTGIGRDGYSIIGQGELMKYSVPNQKIEGLYSKNLGIMKFKVRKQDAERKLELMSKTL
jgi:chromosome segregation protein